MKRKTSELPTRVYSYGCLPPDQNLEVFETQLRLANRYRNKLVEIERRRRDHIRREQEDMFGAEAQELELCRIAADNAYESLKLVKGKRGKKPPPGLVDGEKELLAVTRAQRAAAQAAFKKAKEGANQELLKAKYRTHSVTSKLEVKAARKSSEVYWGTYLEVEKAAEQSFKAGYPPYERFDGEGSIAVQIQKGMPLEALLGGEDTRLRLCLESGSKFGHVLMRGCSDENKKPIWIRIPIKVHRLPPDDAKIMWGRLLRRRVGSTWKYEFQLVCESAQVRASTGSRGQSGAVALDVGWRLMNEAGAIRAGFLLDDTGLYTSIETPFASARGGHITKRHEKADDLRSIRDKNIDAVRERLVEYFREYEIPEEIRDAAAYLHQWRSPKRFVRLLNTWREHRHEGDDEMFALLEAWQQQDRHLWDWHAHQTSRLSGCKKDTWRKWAAGLARKYRYILIEDLDLTSHKIAERPSATEEERTGAKKDQRRRKAQGSAGVLIDCIEKAAETYGAEVVRVNPSGTSDRCSICGVSGAWGDEREKAKLIRTCGACGVAMDRDLNATRNMFWADSSRGLAMAAKRQEDFDDRDKSMPVPPLLGEALDLVMAAKRQEDFDDGRPR